MKYSIVLFLILLQACTLSLGVGYQNTIDEKIMENPIGVVRLSRDYSEHTTGTCEHLSSIPMIDDIITFNFCDISYKF